MIVKQTCQVSLSLQAKVCHNSSHHPSAIDGKLRGGIRSKLPKLAQSQLHPFAKFRLYLGYRPSNGNWGAAPEDMPGIEHNDVPQYYTALAARRLDRSGR